MRERYAESESEEQWERDGAGSSVEAVESGFENEKGHRGSEDDRIEFVGSRKSIHDWGKRMESRWSLNSESVEDGDRDEDEGREEEEGVLERLEAFEFEPENRMISRRGEEVDEGEEIFVGCAL